MPCAIQWPPLATQAPRSPGGGKGGEVAIVCKHHCFPLLQAPVWWGGVGSMWVWVWVYSVYSVVCVLLLLCRVVKLIAVA